MKIKILQGIVDVVRGKISLKRLKHIVFGIGSKSYAQLGEDVALNDLLNNKSNGFYIDVGANNPEMLSNTKIFYDKGWRGINIEANPNLIEAFNIERPEDVNLNIGIAADEGHMQFYILTDDTLSSFSRDEAEKNCKESGGKIEKEISIHTMPLRLLIPKYADSKKIDFMSVDAEGMDLIVLQSNDWSKFRPKFILLEMKHDFDRLKAYMKSIGYSAVYKNSLNYIWEDCHKIS